jgi:hypothetical protein
VQAERLGVGVVERRDDLPERHAAAPGVTQVRAGRSGHRQVV